MLVIGIYNTFLNTKMLMNQELCLNDLTNVSIKLLTFPLVFN